MFDYKITAYNKLGKVQETENLFCTPDEIDDVMYTMSEQYGYAEAFDTMNTHVQCPDFYSRSGQKSFIMSTYTTKLIQKLCYHKSKEFQKESSK